MPLKRKRTSSKGKLPSSVPKIKKLETETETEIEESCDIETPVCEDEEASEEIINSKPAELDQDITEDSNIIVETEDVTPSTRYIVMVISRVSFCAVFLCDSKTSKTYT